MQTNFIPAPYTGNGYVSPGAMTLDVTDNTTDVNITIANPPFIPAWLKVGKEYAPVNLIDQAREYPGQIVACVPSPDGRAEALPACYTKTWDSVIDFKNDPVGVLTMTIPYNDFMRAANGCAFQTDGVERDYYLELITENRSQACKVIFKFTTPNIPGWHYPDGSSTPVIPQDAPQDKKGKGHKK